MNETIDDEALIRFMGNDQLFDFIGVFNQHLAQKNRFVGGAKTYLHLAVE
jgi:hypothetical protein